MEDTKQTLAELKSYHPKNLMSDLFSDNDDDEPVSRSKKSRGSATFDPDAT